MRDEFETFFHRPQTPALGVCNGCQMMSNLRELIPGQRALAALCAQPVLTASGARFQLVEVTQSRLLLLQEWSVLRCQSPFPTVKVR